MALSDYLPALADTKPTTTQAQRDAANATAFANTPLGKGLNAIGTYVMANPENQRALQFFNSLVPSSPAPGTNTAVPAVATPTATQVTQPQIKPTATQPAPVAATTPPVPVTQPAATTRSGVRTASPARGPALPSISAEPSVYDPYGSAPYRPGVDQLQTVMSPVGRLTIDPITKEQVPVSQVLARDYISQHDLASPDSLALAQTAGISPQTLGAIEQARIQAAAHVQAAGIGAGAQEFAATTGLTGIEKQIAEHRQEALETPVPIGTTTLPGPFGPTTTVNYGQRNPAGGAPLPILNQSNAPREGQVQQNGSEYRQYKNGRWTSITKSQADAAAGK